MIGSFIDGDPDKAGGGRHYIGSNGYSQPRPVICSTWHGRRCIESQKNRIIKIKSEDIYIKSSWWISVSTLAFICISGTGTVPFIIDEPHHEPHTVPLSISTVIINVPQLLVKRTIILHYVVVVVRSTWANSSIFTTSPDSYVLTFSLSHLPSGLRWQVLQH